MILTTCRCAEHQKCITDDVLQLSKLRAHKLVLNNNFFLPEDLIGTVVRMFKVEAENKGLYITLNPPSMFKSLVDPNECNELSGANCRLEQRVTLWADPVRITQIVTNIISNAVKFTHSGTYLN